MKTMERELLFLNPVGTQTRNKCLRLGTASPMRGPGSAFFPHPKAKKEAEEPTDGQPLAPTSIGTSHPVPKPGEEARHRPSGHRSLKLSSAKSKGLKANGKSKSKKRV